MFLSSLACWISIHLASALALLGCDFVLSFNWFVALVARSTIVTVLSVWAMADRLFYLGCSIFGSASRPQLSQQSESIRPQLATLRSVYPSSRPLITFMIQCQ